MYDQVSERLRLNLNRVDNLVSIYELDPEVAGKGRRKVSQTDVLRAAVVMLHAAMEDFLRSLLIWKLPSAAPDRLNDIPLLDVVVKKNATKFSLGALASHRGLSVDALITKSVEAYLDAFQSFNSSQDVAGALIDCDLDKQDVDFAVLERMIKRRHDIVHKADRNAKQGKQGHHKVASIRPGEVKEFVDAVKRLRDVVDGQLGV